MKTSTKLGLIAALAMSMVSAKAWIRSDIDNYSNTGLSERYVYGGGCGWWQNNTWDAACSPSGCISQYAGTEGSDCSDYVPRCYALPSYLCTRSCSGHPYSTYSMYDGWSGNVRVTAKYTWMHFVASTCGTEHTGLIRTWDAGGYYSREAHCTACGIEAVYRGYSWFSSTCCRYFLRSNL